MKTQNRPLEIVFRLGELSVEVSCILTGRYRFVSQSITSHVVFEGDSWGETVAEFSHSLLVGPFFYLIGAVDLPSLTKSISSVRCQIKSWIFSCHQVGHDASCSRPRAQPDMMMAESEYDVVSVWQPADDR